MLKPHFIKEKKKQNVRTDLLTCADGYLYLDESLVNVKRISQLFKLSLLQQHDEVGFGQVGLESELAVFESEVELCLIGDATNFARSGG